MPAPKSDRKFDIVVWGATGFTGKLVCSYLSEHADGARWAAAARSRSRLEAAMKEIGCDKADMLTAESNDDESLDALCKSTKCVISLVGPYAIYGSKLVKACAENSTHYFDLNAETPWCARMIQEQHRTALVSRAIMIFSCGFDSIPSDYGAYLAIKQLREAVGKQVRAGSVRSTFKAKDTASGGTYATAMDMMSYPSDVASQLATNPYILSPLPGRQKLEHKWVAKTPGGYGGLFVMAPHNGQIVRRTWGLLESTVRSNDDFAYGPNFSYDEYFALPGPVSAFFFSLVFAWTMAILRLFTPLQWAAKRFGPKSGSGPSPHMLKNGWFTSKTFAYSEDGKQCAEATIKGKGSPGYALTAKMIAECALSVVHDYDRLPKLAKEGGPLTPVTALGDILVERLERTGSFEFSSRMLESSALTRSASKKRK